MNPYLKRKRDQYNALSNEIAEVQARAVAADRDLSDEELTLIRSKSADQAKMLPEIETLTEQENRSASVTAMAAALLGTGDAVTASLAPASADAPADTQTRSAASITTKDRDPGHYTKGGQYSFFGDMHRARMNDDNASTRLVQHNRALATGTEGPGLVAPHWLVEEFQLIARQGRNLANKVRNIPLGNDPRPMTLPKQTVGTDAAILEQANENDATTFTNAYDTDVDTVSPKPTTGGQIVSRQMLDMANPAIDALLYGDMIAAYNLKVEKAVGAALIAAASTVTTFANEAAFANAQDAYDAIVDTGIAVWDNRKMAADIVAMGVLRYGKFLKLKDADGRPLMGRASVGGQVVNAVGSGSLVTSFGNIEGLEVIPTDGINASSAGAPTYSDKIVVARSQDTILFESGLMRFSYEQPLGPESVKLGIWAYTAVIVRQASSSARKIVVTAA